MRPQMQGRWGWRLGSALLLLAAVSPTYANPQPPDSDYDGLLDAWEYQYFGNLSQDGTGNPDNDGLTNLEEFKLNSHPSNPDTDSDGASDGLEVALGRSPNGNDGWSGSMNLEVFTPLK